MITYALECQAVRCSHTFSSDFQSIAAYEKLEKANLISCPQCGGNQVRKGLMAPAIVQEQARSHSDARRRAAAIQRISKTVRADGEFVGSGFAREALRIHRGEAPVRTIYGDATRSEVMELCDEGVPFAAIPDLPPGDA
jgi:hypothetical protein